MGTKADGLRKAAILIDGLDTQCADTVLRGMSDDQVARIRQAVMELEAVSVVERVGILRELGAMTPEAAPSEDVTFEPSLAARIGEPASRGDETTDSLPLPAPAAPFACLADVPPDRLSDFLAGEHPQVASVVLAHLPPRQAADLLRRFPEDRQRDVMHRMVRQDATDGDVLRDVERGLRDLLSDPARRRPSKPSGMAAMEAILNAADEQHRRELLGHLRPDRTPTPQTPATQPADWASSGARSSQRPDRVHGDRFPAAECQQRVSHLLDTLTGPHSADGLSCPSPETGHSPLAPSEPALEFDDFARLDDTSLARIFRSADPQVTLLALCGASRDLVDRILANLPLREARALRNQVEQLGPTRLRDIESAQLQLADLARQMADEGHIQVSRDRRFIGAA